MLPSRAKKTFRLNAKRHRPGSRRRTRRFGYPPGYLRGHTPRRWWRRVGPMVCTVSPRTWLARGSTRERSGWRLLQSQPVHSSVRVFQSRTVHRGDPTRVRARRGGRVRRRDPRRRRSIRGRRRKMTASTTLWSPRGGSAALEADRGTVTKVHLRGKLTTTTKIL